MKRHGFIISTVLIIGLTWSCTNKKENKYSEIKALEEEVFSMKMLDKIKGVQLVDAYVEYAKDFPEDTASAVFLFKAGDIAMNMGMGNQAVLYYDKVMNQFPEFEKVPESLFLKAFIYENQLGDLKHAEKFYKLFLEKYPSHVLAKDAKASLMYLGKSAEELIKIFQEKNQ